MGSGSILKRAIKKYGINSFKIDIIEFFSNDFDLYLAESKIVTKDFIKRDDVYNIKEGGEGGWGHTKNTILVKDCNNNFSRINRDDLRLTSGELTYSNTGMFPAKDKDNNIFNICHNDPRYLSGELVSMFKDTISVVDKNGKNLRVSKYDPRYISSELKGNVYKRILVSDGNKYFRVYKDDIRLKSGVLVKCNGLFFNHHHTEKTKQKLSIAGKRKTGIHNPSYGKCWIMNNKLQKSKSIKKEELECFLDQGWVIGRKIKFNNAAMT